MKSLTYGQLPTIKEFRRAFFANQGTTDTYDIYYSAADYSMLGTLILDAKGEFMGKGTTWDFTYTCEQLYALCEALVDTHNTVCLDEGHTSEEQAEWAGDFASSILSTLGFEWI